VQDGDDQAFTPACSKTARVIMLPARSGVNPAWVSSAAAFDSTLRLEVGSPVSRPPLK